MGDHTLQCMTKGYEHSGGLWAGARAKHSCGRMMIHPSVEEHIMRLATENFCKLCSGGKVYAERSLNERFVDLEDRMISVASLTRYGTANDMKFYIFDYAPKDELLVRREVKKLKSRNPEIVEFDLYEMMLEIIEEEGYLEDIQRMESEYEKDLLLREVFQPLLSVEEDQNSFLDKFKNGT